MLHETAQGCDEKFCKMRSLWTITPSQSRNRCPLSLIACLTMIHCADCANAQRTRMPNAVRAELYVTPTAQMVLDLKPVRTYTARTNVLLRG
jgi:hypothetical protein